MISEEIVEQCWREAATLPPRRARNEMTRIARRQPHLLTFVTLTTQELSRDANELAVYLFFVVYRMFEKAATGTIQRVASDRIIERFEENEAAVQQLEGAHDRFFQRAAQLQAASQPWVVQYIVDALLEPDEENPVELDAFEVGILYLILKTVVDVLDESSA
ncbi:MAG: hypothetical protein D6696_00760 [Acidobacteria bacterium]|nr:MAG: hypothetical protein D6696_00760 [Acidobacteriota bacterium]